MEPYQKRVVEERNELFDKLEKLNFFIDGEVFKTVDVQERNRLFRQAVAMVEYLDILDERITAFE